MLVVDGGELGIGWLRVEVDEATPVAADVTIAGLFEELARCIRAALIAGVS